MTYTKEQALLDLKEAQVYEDQTDDCECSHSTGDEVLCKLLLAYDCAEVVDAWKRLCKWYA